MHFLNVVPTFVLHKAHTTSMPIIVFDVNLALSASSRDGRISNA